MLAREWMRKKEEERDRIRAGIAKPAGKELVIDLVPEFLEERELDHPNSTFQPDVSRLTRVWVPELGAMLVGSIGYRDVNKVLKKLRKEGAPDSKGLLRPQSNASVNRFRAILSKFFSWAIENGYADKNPVAATRALPEEIQDQRRPTGAWESLEKIERYIERAYKEGSLWGALAEVLIFGGPRGGESIAIYWRDVRWADNYILISKIIDKSTGQLFERTKSHRRGGGYTMVLFPRVRVALAAWRRVSPHPHDDDFVFCKEDGGYFRWTTFYRRHRQWVRELRLPYIPPHGLRHSFASLAQQMGYSPYELRDLLGQKTIQVTGRYVHTNIEYLTGKGDRSGFAQLAQPVQLRLVGAGAGRDGTAAAPESVENA